MNNKVLIAIFSIIAIAIGVFTGRSIAHSRAEAKKEYAVALKDYYLFLSKTPAHYEESEKIEIKKDEKFLVLKKEYFGVSKKGKIKRDTQVTGTDNKKYQLKKDDVYEILGWSKFRAGNGFNNYYIKLRQNGELVVSCNINGMYFTPLRRGNWWYVKNKDGKTGWEQPITGYVDLLSKKIKFNNMSKAKAIGGKNTYDIQLLDKEIISFRADNKGTAKLISTKDNKELFVFRNFDNIDGPVDFSVRSVYAENPNVDLWEVSAFTGAHAKNCGYWLVGNKDGKWFSYISENELKEQGYTPKEWHRLSGKTEDGRLIITCSREYMPSGAQFSYQMESIDEMAFEAYWDYDSNLLRIRPWGEVQ